MKIMHCPLNGPRNIAEFSCLGEIKSVPPRDSASAEWAAFTFIENNPAGLVREWWIHVPTNYVFIAERNTLADTFVATYPLDDPRLTPKTSAKE